MASQEFPERKMRGDKVMIPVLLVEESRLFREGLCRILAGTPYEIVYEASSIEMAFALIEQGAQTELVLLDLAADEALASAWILRLRTMLPAARIVVLSGDVSLRKLTFALEVGCYAYLLKDISPEALVQSLRLIMLGEKVFPTNLAQLLLNGHLCPDQNATQLSGRNLSQREQQILRCLINGDSNKVIALRLHITESTVKVHLKGILRKIQVANRTQAAIWAMENSLDKLADLPLKRGGEMHGTAGHVHVLQPAYGASPAGDVA